MQWLAKLGAAILEILIVKWSKSIIAWFKNLKKDKKLEDCANERDVKKRYKCTRDNINS